MKTLETVSLSDPRGRILVYFQYLQDKMAYRCYMVRQLPPYLSTIFLTRNNEMALTVRRIRDTIPRPYNSRANGGVNLSTGGGGFEITCTKRVS